MSTAPAATNDASNPTRQAMLAFVLPMVIYMLVGSLEPEPLRSPPQPAADGSSAEFDEADGDFSDGDFSDSGSDFSDETPSKANWFGFSIPRQYYPVVYTTKIVLTLGVVLWFFPVYRQWPLQVSPLAVGVGVVGVLIWIGCCWLNLEGMLVGWLGEEHWAISWLGLGERPSYNPLQALSDSPNLKYGFLAIRFFGLALLVPIIEEAFLRAFLMRFVMHDNWTEIPFGVVNRMAVIVGVLLPVLYHPEKLAALLWFSLVTWLMVRTKNFWDCVVAHMVTNLLLGIYVVTTGAWQLW